MDADIFIPKINSLIEPGNHENGTIEVEQNSENQNMDLLNDDDEEFQNFMKRKQTIMTNVEHMAKTKYANDVKKQQEIIDEVQQALQEEEQLFSCIRKNTIMRKKLTPEQLA